MFLACWIGSVDDKSILLAAFAALAAVYSAAPTPAPATSEARSTNSCRSIVRKEWFVPATPASCMYCAEC